jgi:BarA-like signal transduction histidine kinase
MTLNKVTLGNDDTQHNDMMTLSIMTLVIMTLNVSKLSTILSMTTFRIIGLTITLSMST